jgi:hypothetical protein
MPCVPSVQLLFPLPMDFLSKAYLQQRPNIMLTGSFKASTSPAETSRTRLSLLMPMLNYAQRCLQDKTRDANTIFQNPLFERIIGLMWFGSKSGEGRNNPDDFDPLQNETLALVIVGVGEVSCLELPINDRLQVQCGLLDYSEGVCDAKNNSFSLENYGAIYQDTLDHLRSFEKRCPSFSLKMRTDMYMRIM